MCSQHSGDEDKASRAPAAVRWRWPLMFMVLVIVMSTLAGVVFVIGENSGPVRVVIRNHSRLPLDVSLVFRPGSSDIETTLAVPPIAPGSSATVRPALGPSENYVVMVGPTGGRYNILGYVEGNPGGTVTVVVDSQHNGLLTGTADDRTHYFPGGETTLTLSR